MTECAQIIYFCQAKNNPNNEQEKEFSQEEIFEKLKGSLGNVPAQIMIFMSRMMAGNKMAVEPSNALKKSSSKPSHRKTP